MAELDAEGTSPRRVNRSWNLALLTAAEPGRRNGRTIDAAFLIIASVGTGLAATVARLAPDVDADIARALATVFGWAPNVWRAAFVFTLAFALLIIGDAIFRRRWILVRDLGSDSWWCSSLAPCSGASSTAIGRGRAACVLELGLPEFRLAFAAAIFAISSPELVRPAGCSRPRRRCWARSRRPRHGPAISGSRSLRSRPWRGCARSTGARLGCRVPPREASARRVASLGVDVESLRSPSNSGSAGRVLRRVRWRTAVKVRVLGRDAQDTQRLARHWQLLAYRDPPRSAPVGRLEQVEHEAVATLMAAQSGVRVPVVVDGRTRPRGGRDPRHARAGRESLEREPRGRERRNARGALAAGRPATCGRHLARQAQRQQRRRHRRGADAPRLLRRDARRPSGDARHRRRGAPGRVHGPRRAGARVADAVAAGWGDSIARVLPVPAARRAHSALARSRSGTRRRVEELRRQQRRQQGRSPQRSCRSGGFGPKTSCSWPRVSSPRIS